MKERGSHFTGLHAFVAVFWFLAGVAATIGVYDIITDPGAFSPSALLMLVLVFIASQLLRGLR